jgi:glycosyltransferase involved in cell wall biosynthesis
MSKKLISIVTPAYNEEANIVQMINKIKSIFDNLTDKYDLELIVIDNCSQDNTVALVKEECSKDKRVKLIINAKNFGWIRSPYHALLQATGEAVVFLASDFQDPPDLIPQFLEKWEEGYSMVLGIKNQSEENAIMFGMRKFFYRILASTSDGEPTIKNFTGFGLYNRKFIEVLRGLEDQYPYLRGLVTELGFNRYELPYTQPKRKAGKTSANFFRLYDVAMLGFTSRSKLPLRLSAFVGFFSAIISFLVAVGYFIYKLIYWNYFEVGMAPLVIGMFFFSSIQLFFIGIIGEYIGAINTQVKKRPLVIEKERINFD